MTIAYKIAIFAGGLYIGKYYPQYVPLPQITKANIEAALKKLEDFAKKSAC